MFAMLHDAAALPPEAGGAVGRTLAVLRGLRHLGPGAHPLAAIALRASLPAATAHRYLQALLGEGAVQRQGPRGHYALVETRHLVSDFPIDTADDPPTGLSSLTVRAELITLQSRTGQIALAYAAILLGSPLRVHAERALGAHAGLLSSAPRASLHALWHAPLETDASGWVIQACLGDSTSARPPLHRIRQDGYAIGASPIAGRDVVAAPVWRGSTVAGAVSLLVSHRQMRGTVVRDRFVTAVMDSAGGISRQLTCGGAPVSSR
ncbi:MULTISPECIES: helix-turn-helix domain-containing protein [unclassified Streptomyces]|uniref:helix-turn-helix domain-containing protein n=1 Tax=unclassified Streptomyces TaxID=2593676 RepID=UPI0033EB5315